MDRATKGLMWRSYAPRLRRPLYPKDASGCGCGGAGGVSSAGEEEAARRELLRGLLPPPEEREPPE